MGIRYAVMAVAPFEEGANQYYRRVLMPAAAHLLGFRGPHLYWLFSLVLTFTEVWLIAWTLWHPLRQAQLNNTRRFLWLASLLSSSFVIYHFQFPGYPDVLLFVLVLAVVSSEASPMAYCAGMALSLAAHEGAAVIWLPIALFLLPKMERSIALGTASLYGAFWLIGSWCGSSDAIAAHSVGGRAAWEYLKSELGWAVLGVFFSFKLLWILSLYGIWGMVRKGERWLALAASASLAFPFVLAVVAVDTSRLVGFGFLGLLIPLNEILAKQGFSQRWLTYLLGANLLVPSYYVGTNTGPQLFTGFYKQESAVLVWLVR